MMNEKFFDITKQFHSLVSLEQCNTMLSTKVNNVQLDEVQVSVDKLMENASTNNLKNLKRLETG